MTRSELNNLPEGRARAELAKCCGSQSWVNQMVGARPFSSTDALMKTAERFWFAGSESDWLEAFTHHPKIGDIKSLEKKFASTKEWAGSEQGEVQAASKATLEKLAALNQQYEDRFSFIFIVCATGKAADEMLELLEARLNNNYEAELKIAMGEQHKITIIRLTKLLS